MHGRGSMLPLIRPIAFPDRVTVGGPVREIGRTSVRYELGVFLQWTRTPLQRKAISSTFSLTQRFFSGPLPIRPEVRELLLGIAV